MSATARSLPSTSFETLNDGRLGRLGRHTLLLGALACVALALAFHVWLEFTDRRETLETAQARIENVAAPVASNVEIIITSLDRGLLAVRDRILADAERLVTDPTAAFGALRTALDHTPLPVNYAIVTPGGTLHATSRFLLPKPIDVSDRDYVRAHAPSDEDRLFVGGAIQSRLAGSGAVPVVPLSRGIWTVSGAFLGVVVVTMETGYFSNAFAGLTLVDPLSVRLLTGDDGPIAAIGPADAPREDHTAPLTADAEIPGNGVHVTVALPRAHALAAWRKRALRSSGMFAGFSLILMTAAFAADRYRYARDRARRETQALMNGAFAGLEDAIVVTDRDCRVILFNAAAGRMARERPGTQKLFDRFPWISQSGCEHLFLRAKETRRPVRHELRLEADDRWLALLIHPFEGGTLLYVRDVTDGKRVADRLARSQKMEAVGQLTGGVAHDFNNLLTVILGNAETLCDELEDVPEQHELAEMIVRAGERGADLTRHLLAFSRRQALSVETTDLGALIEQTGGLLQRALGEHVEMAFFSPPGIWRATVDPAQFESALLNLCINARDAMPDGGRLTIDLSNVHLDDSYAAWNDEVVAGDYVLVGVSDTGSGMTPETAARAFDPFFTTKAVGKGTGLGLSMVYGFIKQSKGHVKIYSEEGRGTTVKLYLPRALDGAETAERPSTTAAVVGGDERILLVEDDILVRAHVTTQLAALGYDVVAAADGVEAMAIIERGERFDLLFTDVVMPGGMSGRKLADQARTVLPSLPVLFTSGYTENAIVHHGHLDPGVDLLNKPFRQADLARKVREVLDRPGRAP